MIEGYPGIILEISSDGLIVNANDVFRAKFGPDAVGRPLATFVDAASSTTKLARILANARTAGETRWELVFTSPGALDSHSFSVARDDDQRRVWLIELPRDVSVEKLTDQLVNVNSSLVETQRELARDRSKLGAAYDALSARNSQLERVNRELDDFARVASHDLKASLRAIATFAAKIEKEIGSKLSAESTNHFALLQSRVQLLEKMIDGMLSVARVGNKNIPAEDVDTAALVREVTGMLEVPPRTTIIVDANMPTVRSVRPQLMQVFLNLLSNAVMHSGRDDARIEVEGTEMEGGWKFVVRDNGAGIAPEEQERIWDLFRTAGTREDMDASGIGLAIVKKIVERRGGRVSVESAPGQGSAFYFEWMNDKNE